MCTKKITIDSPQYRKHHFYDFIGGINNVMYNLSYKIKRGKCVYYILREQGSNITSCKSPSTKLTIILGYIVSIPQLELRDPTTLKAITIKDSKKFIQPRRWCRYNDYVFIQDIYKTYIFKNWILEKSLYFIGEKCYLIPYRSEAILVYKYHIYDTGTGTTIYIDKGKEDLYHLTTLLSYIPIKNYYWLLKPQLRSNFLSYLKCVPNMPKDIKQYLLQFLIVKLNAFKLVYDEVIK